MSETFERPSFPEETHWEKAAKTRMGKYLTRVEKEFIESSVNISPDCAIMDVGAEAGRFSQLSTGAQTITVSIDIESYGLKRLKEKASGINVVQADARCIPFKDDVFDAIFMIEVLDYIPQLDSVFSDCRRVLKHKGSIILSFGNKASLKSKMREMAGKSYLHSHRQILDSLERNNLAPKRKTGYNWLPFGRISENPFIPVLAWIEGAFGLRRLPRLSPWVLIWVTKT